MQPTQLGPFQIVRVIGRGGMGAVYEGIHVQTLDRAAVKVLLNPVEEDRELHLRFDAEIEILKKLRHPNIVRLYGFGFEDQVQYYVMELVEGQSLQQELRRKRRFTWQEVCRIGWEMSQALKHAHDRGIIHRDIKPANILLEQRGGVKISDYGIAHIFGGSRLTGDHSVVGTLEYMSPEQSQAAPTGPKSDLFSLGAVLYTLLTGVSPYRAKTLAELLKRHKEANPKSIGEYRDDVPEMLEEVIFELLNIKPENRPSNAYILGRRLLMILRAYLGNPDLVQVKPSPEAPEKSSEQFKSPSRSNPSQSPSAKSKDRNLLESASKNTAEPPRSVPGLPRPEETFTYGGGEIGPSKADFELRKHQDSFHFSDPNMQTPEKSPEPENSTQKPGERIENVSLDSDGAVPREVHLGQSGDSSENFNTPRTQQWEDVDSEIFLPKKLRSRNPFDDFHLFIRHDTNRHFPTSPHESQRNEGDEDDYGKTAGNISRTSREPKDASDQNPPEISTQANTVHTVMERPTGRSENLSDQHRNYRGPVIGGTPVRSDHIFFSEDDSSSSSGATHWGRTDRHSRDGKTLHGRKKRPKRSPKADEQHSSTQNRRSLRKSYVDWRNMSVYSLKKELQNREKERRTNLTQSGQLEQSVPYSLASRDSLGQGASVKDGSELSLPPAPQSPDFLKNRPIGPQDLVSDTTGSTTSHFVMVHEEELGDYTDQKVNKPRSTILQTTLASICLIFLGLFLFYMLQPVSPDVLYERIKTKIADDQESEDGYSVRTLGQAENNIDLFLSLYPDDPRASEMTRYIEELKLHRLHREFERQVSRFSDTKTLTSIERATYEAFVILRTDPELALGKFQAIIDFYGSDPTFLASFDRPETNGEEESEQQSNGESEDEGNANQPLPTMPVSKDVTRFEQGRPRSQSRSDLCLEIARRQVREIRTRLDNDIQEQGLLLRNRLDFAVEQEEISPERAKKVREAILELYKNKTWAEPYLEEAREALGPSET